jgi:nucleotide-binding universal stress UspA family protein
MLTIHSILYPTDFSDLSRPAFDLACALARDYDARLIICHVTRPPMAGVVDGIFIEPPPPNEEDELQARLESIQPVDPDIEVSYRLERDEAVPGIVRLAKEVKADLIVLGTHGRSGVSRLVLGSVAEGVMRKAPCPVLTVRAGQRVEVPA